MTNFAIDLPLSNSWPSVEQMRVAVDNCCAAMGGSADRGYTLSMVTSELLENAVKYGDWKGEPGTFRFRLWGESDRAFISVENPVRDDDPWAKELVSTLRWIDNFPSAEEAYQARLLEVAQTRGSGPGSLGLVRVVYEGDCKLRVEMAHRLVRVLGEMPLGIP